MKRKLITIGLLFLLYMIFVSCGACMSRSNPPKEMYSIDEYSVDSTMPVLNISEDTITMLVITTPDETTYEDKSLDTEDVQQEAKKITTQKKIEPVEIDTLRKTQRAINYKQLEKTEEVLKEQHKEIDSLIFVKSKK